jgi:hypothetical protein
MTKALKDIVHELKSHYRRNIRNKKKHFPALVSAASNNSLLCFKSKFLLK